MNSSRHQFQPLSIGTAPVSFKYDPLGRRIYKQCPNATSVFAYDGCDLVETVNATGAMVARYVQGAHIDEPLAMLRGSTTNYYEADGLGPITSLTTAAGATATGYSYDSLGNITNPPSSITNFLRYTGREFDAETGLYYYRARYYDPVGGGFINEDPLGRHTDDALHGIVPIGSVLSGTMTRSRVFLLVHILPFLHLCACLVIALARLGAGWQYMFLIDAPASGFVLALSYNYDHPLILFGTIGTLWWYLLSYAAAFGWIRLSAAIRNRRTSRAEANLRD
jgi:RHS repeat-associated protein